MYNTNILTFIFTFDSRLRSGSRSINFLINSFLSFNKCDFEQRSTLSYKKKYIKELSIKIIVNIQISNNFMNRILQYSNT